MMNKNEDRIWDTLIEDALREGAAQPQSPGEYTRRLMTPVGAPGVDRGRSLRRPRRKWAPVAVTALALLLVAIAVYAATTWLPQLSLTEPTDQPQAAEEPNQNPPRKRCSESPSPTPRPEPQDSGPTDSGEPAPDNVDQPPEPKPDDTVDQPKPAPKPDDTVELPKLEPEPDDTIEQPKPEPKPDDSVEQPRQPEGTGPTPQDKPRINLLTVFDWERPGKELLYSTDGEAWLSTRYIKDFAADVWLRSTKAVDLEAGGIFVRVHGEVRLQLSDSGLIAALNNDTLYLDNRGAARGVTVTIGAHTLTCESGEAMLVESAGGDEVRVYSGEVRLGNSVIAAGQHGDLKRSGFVASRRAFKPRGEEALLADLKERVVYREDFDNNPKGRLREGEIKAGALTGPTVFWGYPDNLQHEAGTVLRLRVRFTGATGATVTQFAVPRNDNFSLDVQPKHGEWQILELKVDDFLERTTHKEHPSAADWFQNISIQLKGENAQIELDWIELIRAVKK